MNKYFSIFGRGKSENRAEWLRAIHPKYHKKIVGFCFPIWKYIIYVHWFNEFK